MVSISGSKASAADLADGRGRLFAGVPEPVRGPAGTRTRVAGSGDEVLAEPEAELACKDLEALLLAGWTWAPATAPFGSTRYWMTTYARSRRPRGLAEDEGLRRRRRGG